MLIAQDLRDAFGVIPAFDFCLVEICRFTATAYLHPEPSAALARLTQMLANRWPGFPPYGGSFSTVIRHLTIADQATAEVLDAVASGVARHLPISCRATEAWLICSDESGFWSKREAFRFNPARLLSSS